MMLSHQPAMERLLASCTGCGRTVVVGPSEDNPHHFYAGVSRAPEHSLLGGILLAVGGNLPDGERRYPEIVVVNAGADYDEDGRDKPSTEILRLPIPGGITTRGEYWKTWWYRRATPAAVVPPAGEDSDGATRSATSKWRARPSPVEAAPRDQWFPDYGIQVQRECGRDFPKRHQALKQIIERLAAQPHRSLLVVELSVLDYEQPGQQAHAVPGSIPRDHSISETGTRDMEWLVAWVDRAAKERPPLDVVYYSRNALRVRAFLGEGLPRRPAGYSGDWRAIRYSGRNIVQVAYPCGAFPWGDHFTRGGMFQSLDGTESDTKDGQERYRHRTLTALLRGRTASSEPVRVKFTGYLPDVPAVTGGVVGIDAAYWDQVDLDGVEKALAREYFGADDNVAIRRLLETLRAIQHLARTASHSLENTEVKNAWRKDTALALWGTGGGGKSYLGDVLCRLLFGHPPCVIRCNQAGGGGRDPALFFKSAFFGSPPGHVGSEALTAPGAHILARHGYTVLVFDEVDGIAGADSFAESIRPLYGLLWDRTYEPTNTQLVSLGGVPLWNTIIVMTANLAQWPPANVDEKDREALERRVSPSEYAPYDASRALSFAQWYLSRYIERELRGVAVCHAADLSRQFARLGLSSRTPDSLIRALEPLASRVSGVLLARGFNSETVPRFLDVTTVLADAIDSVG